MIILPTQKIFNLLKPVLSGNVFYDFYLPLYSLFISWIYIITCLLNWRACHGNIKRKEENFIPFLFCYFSSVHVSLFIYYLIIFLFYFVDSLRLKLMEQSDKITELEESGNTSINKKNIFLNMSRDFSELYFWQLIFWLFWMGYLHL